MRIVHVTDGFEPRLGGIESQVGDLARRQAATGHDVQVVTSVGAAASDSDAVVTHRPPSNGNTSGRIQWTRTAAGVQSVLDGNFDLVHAHVSIASPLAISAIRHAARFGLPVAATVHSIWGRPTAVVAALVTPSHRGRSRVAWSAVSSAAAAPIESLGAFPVRVVPNGIDAQWWREGPTPQNAPTPRRLRLLTTMRLARRKRPIPMLRIVREVNVQLAASGLGVELTIAGDGPLAPSLARVIEREPKLRVSLAGRLTRTQLRDLMSEHDLYVAPARLESFGIAALEARCAGLPVLADCRSGVRDFIIDGCDGRLVASDEAMIDTLSALATDRVRTATLQAQARSWLPDVGWDRTISAYDALYAEAHECAAPGGTVRAGARSPIGAQR